MGVLDKPRHHAVTIREADVTSEVSEDALSIPDSELSEAQSSLVAARSRRTRHARSRPRGTNTGIGSAGEVGNGPNKRGNGRRAKHRVENLNHLMEFLGSSPSGEEGDGDGPGTRNELIEEAVSVFARILEDTELMSLWEDFISRSETEQRAMLSRGRVLSPKRKMAAIVEETETEDGFVEIGGGRPSRDPVSGDVAFARVSAHLRCLLKRRHFPIGMLAHLEDQVVSFFQDFPDAVFISDPLPSMDRLVIHALSQFHALKAESFDGGAKGTRRTRVENEFKDFTKPEVSLLELVEGYHQG